MAARLREDDPRESSVVIAVALWAVLAVGAGAVTSSNLCIDGTCRPTGDERPTVTASDMPRSFVWISADSGRVVVGTIAPGMSKVPIDSKESISHDLTVATSDGSRGVEVGFELRCGSTWKWTLKSGPKSALEIRHPPGECTLVLEAEGYASVERPFAGADLGRVILNRLPVLTGTITDATTRAPIGFAEVFLPGGELLAASDAAGRFRAPVEGPWPRWVRVEAPGRAGRTVQVPGAVADTDLPITMSTGGSVAVTLEPPLGEEPVTWEVRRSVPSPSSEDRIVRSGKIPAGKAAFDIEALEPGEYRVIVMGEGPLQRFGVPVTVGDGTIAEASVRISPAVIDLDVLFDDKPLSGATVELSFELDTWRASITTDTEGRSREEIWQRGSYMASVSRAPLVPYWSDTRDIDEDGTTRWTITVADRKLIGRVIDEANQQPLGDALIILEWSKATGGGAMTTQRSAADGTFEFAAMPVSSYSLQATKEGYQPLQTPALNMTEEARTETRDLLLRRSVGRPLRVINSHGIPIPSAEVYVVGREGARRTGGTDAGGRSVLTVKDDESGTIFVLPRSGSIGFGRFAALTASGTGEIVIRVADPTASLEVVAESSDGESIAGVAVMLRVDGVLLPLEVREAMTNHQGVPLLTDAQGRMLFGHLPAGRYEIWPLASRDDLLAVLAPSPPPAPINLMLTPGHHTARLKFRPKP